MSIQIFICYAIIIKKAKIYAIIISENNIHWRHYVMFISWLCSCVSSPQWFERWSSSSMSNIHCWPIMHLSMTKLYKRGTTCIKSECYCSRLDCSPLKFISLYLPINKSDSYELHNWISETRSYGHTLFEHNIHTRIRFFFQSE